MSGLMFLNLQRHVFRAASLVTTFPLCVRYASRRQIDGKKSTSGPGKKAEVPIEHGSPSKRLGEDHGRHIYVYHHIRTNQILYSLSKRLKNLAALRQLPFNGKKSKPEALRKDHWLPLAQITLPEGHGDVGRSIYGKLREYKMLHELAWDPESMRKENGELMARKDRRKVLDNQKPNAVADMAVVLGKLNEDSDNIGLAGVGQGITVEILWTNITDAYYASEWSENVLHDSMKATYNNRDPTMPRPFNKKMAEYKAIKQSLEPKEAQSENDAATHQEGQETRDTVRETTARSQGTQSSQGQTPSMPGKRRMDPVQMKASRRRSREKHQYGFSQLRGQAIDQRTNSLKIAPAATTTYVIRSSPKSRMLNRHRSWALRPLSKKIENGPPPQDPVMRHIVRRQDPILIRRKPGPGTWALRPLIQAQKIYQAGHATSSPKGADAFVSDSRLSNSSKGDAVTL